VFTAACISARDEEKTIRPVITQACLTPGVDIVLIVVNGSSDRTAELARTGTAPGGRARVLVREVPEPLGHDVGRSVAADWALVIGAEVLVFLDADFPVLARDISPFIRAVESGTDVALNRLSSRLGGWASQGPVASARRALNVFLGYDDLGQDGLVAVPHALSGRAARVIGPENLSVPPLAHALAVMAGLRVRAVHSVDVITPNRPSPDRARAHDPAVMGELILGDHVEAVAEIIRRRGPRGGFPDHGRKRSHTAGGPRQE
jgi:glycosyltransferase involved in cell wall biosynthesis